MEGLTKLICGRQHWNTCCVSAPKALESQNPIRQSFWTHEGKSDERRDTTIANPVQRRRKPLSAKIVYLGTPGRLDPEPWYLNPWSAIAVGLGMQSASLFKLHMPQDFRAELVPPLNCESRPPF